MMKSLKELAEEALAAKRAKDAGTAPKPVHIVLKTKANYPKKLVEKFELGLLQKGKSTWTMQLLTVFEKNVDMSKSVFFDIVTELLTNASHQSFRVAHWLKMKYEMDNNWWTFYACVQDNIDPSNKQSKKEFLKSVE